MAINNVTLTGRWTKDIETRVFEGEKANMVAFGTLAVDRRFVNKNDENAPKADFIRIKMWGKTAEFADKWLGKKGQKVEVVGRIETGSYKNANGDMVYTTDVVAEQLGFGESKGASEANGGGGNSGGASFVSVPDVDTSDLPFK